MQMIQNAHSEKVLEKTQGFLIQFGNLEYGFQFDKKEEMIDRWRWFAKQRNMINRNGDLYLYFNGKLIRAIHNYDCKITGSYGSNAGVLRPAEYGKCSYKKFK